MLNKLFLFICMKQTHAVTLQHTALTLYDYSFRTSPLYSFRSSHMVIYVKDLYLTSDFVNGVTELRLSSGTNKCNLIKYNV